MAYIHTPPPPPPPPPLIVQSCPYQMPADLGPRSYRCVTQQEHDDIIQGVELDREKSINDLAWVLTQWWTYVIILPIAIILFIASFI